MELCEGGSVTDICQDLNQPLDEAAIKVLTKGTLEGLLYLHENRIIHRDIKGANILLNGDGEVKLSKYASDASTCAMQ
jgi:STE20-like kinase